MSIKANVRRMLRASGYEVVRADGRQLGKDDFLDIHAFLSGEANPVIFDIGANVGQTVRKTLNWFQSAEIHAFEPGPTTFNTLRTAVGMHENVHLWNIGMAAAPGRMGFNENSHSTMSSFRELGPMGWGEVETVTEVAVTTVDAFSAEHGIDHIDLLKSDTQGYDLEVMKGADRMVKERRIKLVLMELTLVELYQGLPAFDEVLRYMRERDFALAGLYECAYQQKLLAWLNALFISRDFHQRLAHRYSMVPE